MERRKWLHFRKKIKHNVANLRLWQKPPSKVQKEESHFDEMQELRINQYGKYIQEKLGLFKKPKAFDIMLYNFERDKSMSSVDKDETRNSPANSMVIKPGVMSQRVNWQTESPKVKVGTASEW